LVYDETKTIDVTITPEKNLQVGDNTYVAPTVHLSPAQAA
jgi:hypothetical protein